MKRLTFVIMILLIPLASITLADEQSHKRAALKLIEVSNTKKILEQVMDHVEKVMDQQFHSMDLPPEGREAANELQKELIIWFSDLMNWEQMKALYAEIYIDVYSEGELIELVEFYESPLGQKLLAKMPELMQKTMMRTQAMIQDKMPEFKLKMEKTMTELKRKYKKS